MDIEEIRENAVSLAVDCGPLEDAHGLKRAAALLYQLAVEQERFEAWTKSEIERLERSGEYSRPVRGEEASQ